MSKISILWLIVAVSLVTAKCLPVPSNSDTGQGHPRSHLSEDILKQFNMTKQDIEVAKGRVSSPAKPSDVSLHKLLRERPDARKGNRALNNRKQEIQQRVWGYVTQNGRFPPTIDSSLAQKGEKVAEMFNTNGVFGINIGRVRYLLPSCDVPKHVDEDLWTANGTMHLYFNVGHVQPREGYNLSITSAKLRLYKYPEGETHKGEEDCADSTGTQVELGDEEKVRVSVHNYTKPLRKHRNQKRKLLDSQMAFVKEESLMELDVRLAVRGWLSGGRNLGLVVEVEDTEGQRVPSKLFFRSRDCSNTEGSRSDEVVDPSVTTSPLLELTIVEIPEGRSLEQILSAVPSSGDTRGSHRGFDDIGETVPNVEDTATGHKRTRHHQRHHQHHHYEEQADDANRAPFIPSTGHGSNSHTQHSKQHGKPQQHPASSYFSRVVPFPTLATLEDHDLMGPSEPEHEDDVETKESTKEEQQHKPLTETLPIISHHSFMQRILESQLGVGVPSRRDSRRV